MVLGVPHLINVLLILAGPFLLVGAQTAIAGASWPGLLVRLFPRPARPVRRGAVTW